MFLELMLVDCLTLLVLEEADILIFCINYVHQQDALVRPQTFLKIVVDAIVVFIDSWLMCALRSINELFISLRYGVKFDHLFFVIPLRHA